LAVSFFVPAALAGFLAASGAAEAERAKARDIKNAARTALETILNIVVLLCRGYLI
jgi:hypothetical protein